MGSIAVIGAGNVGVAIAGHMTIAGHDVRIYDRWGADLEPIKEQNGIEVVGDVQGHAMPAVLTTDLQEAVTGAELVVVVTPAFAHSYLSGELAKVLEPSQVVVFQPGVLGSALELAHMFAKANRPPCTIAETSTSLYTCRLRGPGKVYIGAIKHSIPIAAVPASATPRAIAVLSRYFGERYAPVEDTLTVGLSRISAIYHVPPAVLNFKTVEDADRRPLHSLVTPRIAEVVNAVDLERLSLADALGIRVPSFWDFLRDSYRVTEGSFLERIVQGYGRQSFPEPDSIRHRYFTEDIPFGLVAWSSLAREIGLSLPLVDSLIDLSGVLCGRDFVADGRTTASLGLEGRGGDGIRSAFTQGVVAPDVQAMHPVSAGVKGS